jgi:O-antigen ligase
LTRTGWLMLAVVAVLVLALNFKKLFSYGNRRLIALAVVGSIVILVVPQTNALISGGSGAESAKLERSANYRSLLIQQALTPGYINPLGTSEQQIGPGGTTSIDNEYIHVAWRWGYLPFVGFSLMFIAFVRGAWRQRRDIVALTVYATCIATMVGIESVAFITQQEVLIWLLWGCASGLTVRPAQDKLEPIRRAAQLQTRKTRLAAGSAGAQPVVIP